MWVGSCSSENVQYLEGIIELHYYHHATPREINDSKQVPLMDTNTKKRTAPLQQAVPGSYHLNQMTKLGITSSLTI